MVLYHILLKLSISVNFKFSKDQNWSSRCNEFVFQKVYLSKYVFWILPSIWSVLLEYLHHFYVAIFYEVFFEMFAFFCFCCYLVVAFVLFSFVFISGRNFNCCSKDKDVTTATVDLNIRTIIVLLLLTLKIVLLLTGTISPINLYRIVFNSTLQDFS